MGTKEGRSLQKARVGRVVSDRMDKTVVVAVDRLIQNPLYGKYIRKTAKVYAHDRNNECKIGDKVRVAEVKPLSKMKRWRVVEIIERAK